MTAPQRCIFNYVAVMKKYRGKPLSEPLTPVEAALCQVAYFQDIQNDAWRESMKKKFKQPWWKFWGKK